MKRQNSSAVSGLKKRWRRKKQIQNCHLIVSILSIFDSLTSSPRKIDWNLTLHWHHLPSFPNTCWNCYKITIWSHLLIKEPNKREKKQEQVFKNNTRDASSSTRLHYIRLWFPMPICSRKHPVDKRAIHLKLPNEKQNEASLMERGFCERRKSGMAAGQSSPM